jgi:hypothetical protein
MLTRSPSLDKKKNQSILLGYQRAGRRWNAIKVSSEMDHRTEAVAESEHVQKFWIKCMIKGGNQEKRKKKKEKKKEVYTAQCSLSPPLPFSFSLHVLRAE